MPSTPPTHSIKKIIKWFISNIQSRNLVWSGETLFWGPAQRFVFFISNTTRSSEHHLGFKNEN